MDPLTTLKTCFGTPDVASDWGDVLLRLVLATTETRSGWQLDIRRTELQEVIQRGSSALEAASLRFQMIERQYERIFLYEEVVTDGVGIVVIYKPYASQAIPRLRQRRSYYADIQLNRLRFRPSRSNKMPLGSQQIMVTSALPRVVASWVR
jgi:hypothetical protein